MGHVTRINPHSGACACCGKRVAAKAPSDMPVGSPFGPGITALVVYMHTRHVVLEARLRHVVLEARLRHVVLEARLWHDVS